MGPRLHDELGQDDWDSENWSNYLTTGSPYSPDELAEEESWPSGPDLRPDGYTADWDKISSGVRVKKGYRCEKCKVIIKDRPKLLHVHHVNRDKTDNATQNLMALCAICHSEQDGHGHLYEQIMREDLIYLLALRRLTK